MKHKTKIAFYQQTLNESGSEYSFLEIMKFVNENALHLEPILIFGEDNARRFVYTNYGNVYSLEAPKLSRKYKSIIPFLKSFLRLFSFLKKSDCRLAYVNSLMFLQPIIISWVKRIPVITHVREVEATYPKAIYYIYLILASAISEKIIAVTGEIFNQRSFKLLPNSFKSKFIVIHNFSSDAIGQVEPTQVADKFILSVIPITKRKGVLDLIAAYVSLSKKLNNNPPSLYIAGRIDEVQTYAEAINILNESGLVNNVKFLGQIDHHTLIGYYKSANILVHPSETEALPRVLIEAQKYGLPSVATNVGGTSEIIADGINGYIVDKNSPSDMSAKMLILIQNPCARGEMSKSCLLSYESKFTREKNGALIIDVINKVIKSKC